MSAMQKQISLFPVLVFGVVLLSLSRGVIAQSVCPAQFHTIPLIEDAKFCQQFDDKLPASLSFHSLVKPDAALTYYLELFGNAEQTTSKGRKILQAPGDDWVLVISADGDGSQIDILVKKALEE